MDDFERICQYGRELESGFNGLCLFRDCFEDNNLLSDDEPDLLDRFIERAGGFVDGYNAALEKMGAVAIGSAKGPACMGRAGPVFLYLLMERKGKIYGFSKGRNL